MQQRIARILEPHYETLAQFEQLSAVYEAVLSHAQEPTERLQQYYRLAELHEERLLAPDAALSVYIRALQEYPHDERTLDDIGKSADRPNHVHHRGQQSVRVGSAPGNPPTRCLVPAWQTVPVHVR